MFIWRILLRPAVGRAGVLRQQLLQSTGSDAGFVVGARLFGDSPLFSVNHAFESLAAFDKFRRSWHMGSEVAQHLRQTPASELWQIPELEATGEALPRFTVRFTFEAAPAKSRELLETVQRFVCTRGTSAPPSQVWLRVSGGANAVALIAGYPSLTALEQAGTAALSDPSTQAFAAAIAALTAPVQTPEIFEILVPAS